MHIAAIAFTRTEGGLRNMVYLNELERIRLELNERKNDLLQELQTLPEGKLMLQKQNGIKKYVQRIPATGNRKKERRYGVKKKPEILNGLIRKEYVTKALRLVDRDIRAVDLAVRRYIPLDEDCVMGSFLSDNPELADGIHKASISDEEWRSEFDSIVDFHPESLKQIAADGTRRRSKNELYIASRLDHYGIAYRFDCPTGIPGLYRVPDFTILRKSDRKIIYWEHMGMMDDLEYRIDNKRKLEEYENFDIVPWDNLILTYDTVSGGLHANLIEAMIQSWLL